MKNTLEKVIDLISELESLKPIKVEIQKILDTKIRLEFNYNSNHLEGNTLTYSETELLLKFDKTGGNHEMREFEEMKAHDVAYKLIQEWSSDADFQLTETKIRELNEIILVKPFYKDAETSDGQKTRRLIKVGQYKEHPNSVRLPNGELFEYASPIETPIKMGELIEWFRKEELLKQLHPVELAAILHHKFVLIHPFDDGNGRISRLLINYILLKNNLPPIIIKTSDKKNYLYALNQADVGNMSAFVKYISEQLIWSLNLYIKAAKGNSIEEEGDLDKRIELMSKELNAVNEDQEVKMTFSQETLVYMFSKWIDLLIEEAIPAIQKFNHLFTNTNHNIYTTNFHFSKSFSNQNSEKVAYDIISEIKTNKNELPNQGFNLIIQTSYGTLIKGGLNTFGCNYQMSINFEQYKYNIVIDKFVADSPPDKLVVFERLLHQPLNTSEIKTIVKLFTETIFNHIDYHTKKTGLR